MLSWDEFDKEDRNEFFVISKHTLMGKDRVREAMVNSGDSAALRRAKAALDALDVAESLAELEGRFSRRHNRINVFDIGGQTITFTTDGVYSLYDFHNYHARVTETLNFLNKLVLIFAVSLLSSICCSRFTSARNAEFRIPLFAYDAELSINRHRLRTAL